MLNKTLIPLNLFGGVNTKVDPKNSVPGTLTTLENGVFKKVGEIAKRNGYDLIGDFSISDSYTGAIAMQEYRKNLFCVIDGQIKKFNQIFEGETQTVQNIPQVNVSTKTISADSYDRVSVDMAVSKTDNSLVFNDYKFIVSSNENNEVFLEVFEKTTGSFIYKEAFGGSQFDDNTILNPKIEVAEYTDGVSVKRRILISAAGYITASSAYFINIYYLDLEDIDQSFYYGGNNINHLVALVTDCASNCMYDLSLLKTGSLTTLTGGKVVVAYNKASGGIGLSSCTLAGGSVSTSSTIGSGSSNCISLDSQSSNLYLGYSIGSSTDYNVLNASLSSTSSGNIAGVKSVNIARVSSTNFIHEIEGTSGKYNSIKYNGVDIGLKGVGLASKVYNNYVLTVNESTLQSTYFLQKITASDSSLVAKFNQSRAGGLYSSGCSLPHIVEISDTQFEVPCLIKNKFVSQGITSYSIRGVCQATFETNTQPYLINTQNSLLLSGGYVRVFDGIYTTEQGFHLFPEGIENTSTASTGGYMSDGTYLYRATYEWTDNAGNYYESAPSEAISVVLSGGTSTQKISVKIPSLWITDKYQNDLQWTISTSYRVPKANVKINLYRTENSGTLYHLVGSAFSSYSAETITIEDISADGVITSSKVLYTSGGVLEHISMNNAKHLCLAKNRVFFVDDKDRVGYSKEFIDGETLNFNDNFYINIPKEGGAITGITSYESKVIIFKETSILFFAGKGPDELGQNDDFTEVFSLSRNVGCNNPNSIVESPDGLLFKSNKGIYIIQRNMAAGVDQDLVMDYIGAPVEQFNSLTITGSQMVEDQNQVRFLTSDGVCLVYDFFYKQWSTFTNHMGKSSCNYLGKYTYMRNNGEIYQENVDKFLDNTDRYSLKLTTGWISFNQITGLQRIYKMLLLGEYKSAHKFFGQIAYNFKPFTDTFEFFTTDHSLESSTFGDDPTFGESDVFGGLVEPYEFCIRPKTQKCQSIRLTLEETPIGSATGESLTLSNITFEVGGKPGVGKFSKSKKIGAIK